MAIDADFLKALIEADDPLTVIFQRMLQLWHVEAFPADVVQFYNERETRFCQFEEALHYGYFEIYELLLQRAQQQDGGYMIERLQGDSIVIIADSLSVREVGLLKKRLSDCDWQVNVEGFVVAPFPTLTESLSEKLLGAYPAGGKDTSAFRYRYVAGPGEVPNLPVGEKTLVWLRLPDKKLEQVTVAQATTIADAFNATLETLTQLLEQAATRPVFITSDHGYLYATDVSHYWKMPVSIEEDIRKVFSRESRAQQLIKEGVGALLHNKRDEQRYFVCGEKHVSILGRYWWASVKTSDRCTAHGGLSLTEALVPLIIATPHRFHDTVT